MSFWFDHIPEEYPSYDEVINEAGVQSANGDPREGINYLLCVVGALPPSPVRQDYENYVRYSFAENQLSNPTITPEQKVQVFRSLFRPSRELANNVADTGKGWSLAESEDDRRVGRQLLDYAAEVFEEVVSELGATTPLETKFEIVIEDYARVAGLQDEASDASGAKATALKLVPHLLALHAVAEGDERYLSMIACEAELMALYIDDLEADEYKLLREILPERGVRKVEQIVTEKARAADADSVERLEEIIGELSSQGQDPDHSLWLRLHGLSSSEKVEDIEVAAVTIETIHRCFPGLFEQAKDRMLTFYPVESTLFLIGRDDLLALYYASLLPEQGVSVLSKFAGQCGYESTPERLRTLVSAVGLTAEQNHRVFDMYEKGRANRD